jgi:16S rRNA (adenine1518-N6/adenine1519-N6)-dimethyltransferase
LNALPTPLEAIQRYGQPAKKKHGQNFLFDEVVLDRIVTLAGVTDGQHILEIGPGPGTLTSRLLVAGARVTAIEADPDLLPHLSRAFDGYPLEVIHGDATRFDLGSLREQDDSDASHLPDVVANLPYHVATPILFRLVDHERAPRRMTLMFQREVGERIVSPGARRDFGKLSIGVQVRYTARLGMLLPPDAFVPAPKVESAVVVLERRPVPLVSADVEKFARRIAAAAFNQRRKMLRATLGKQFSSFTDSAEAAGVAPTLRPEAVLLQDFLTLAKEMHSREQT